MPDKVEEVVDIIRMSKGKLWSFINPSNNAFALKNFDEFRKRNAIPQRLFHIYNSEP